MLETFWNKIVAVASWKYMALLFILTTIAAALVNYLFSFDGIDFNGDSYVYFRMALHFKESITSLTLPRHEHWPYGYPALLSLSFLFSETFKAAQWVNFIAGGMLTVVISSTVVMIAKFKNPAPEKTTLLVLCSMILLVAHGTMLKYQLLLMSDMTGALGAMLSLVLIWKWKISKKLIFVVIAGIALGFAVSTRFVYLLMFLPTMIVFFSERSLKEVGFPILTFGLFFAITLLPELLIVLNIPKSGVGYDLMNDWNIKNAVTLSFESIDGHQTTQLPSILYYFLLPFRWEDFTPIGFILAGTGCYYAIRQLPRWLWLSLSVWYLAFYILLCGIPIQNPRIAFSLHQPLIVFICFGILFFLRYWQPRTVFLCLAIIASLSIGFGVKYIKKMADDKNKLKETADQVAVITGNSQIISTSLYAVYLAYPKDVEPFSIYTMNLQQADSLLNSSSQTFLAIDEEKFIPQWSTYTAGKTYWWIRKNYLCRKIARVNEYTVYEIIHSITKSEES
jgi:hypothetical protein